MKGGKYSYCVLVKTSSLSPWYLVTANWHFLRCHVFPVVSELNYLLLEHAVTNDDLEFCLWEISRQGGS